MITLVFEYLYLLLLTAIFWYAVVYTIGRITGWLRLARHYPSSATGEAGEKLTLVRLRLRVLTFNNAITLVALGSGLKIRAPFIFRLALKDLYIPWPEVLFVKRGLEAWKGFRRRETYQFLLEREKGFSLVVSAATGEWILGQRSRYTT